MKDYFVILFWSEEDRCYVADIPELFPCAAFGDTPEEALAELLRAREALFETARDHGLPMPPSTRLRDFIPEGEGPS